MGLDCISIHFTIHCTLVHWGWTVSVYILLYTVHLYTGAGLYQYTFNYTLYTCTLGLDCISIHFTIDCTLVHWGLTVSVYILLYTCTLGLDCISIHFTIHCTLVY